MVSAPMVSRHDRMRLKERRDDVKLARTILACGMIFLAYEAGKLIGHLRCLDKFVDKYGDDILEKHAEIIDDIHPKFTIKVVKPSNSE